MLYNIQGLPASSFRTDNQNNIHLTNSSSVEDLFVNSELKFKSMKI